MLCAYIAGFTDTDSGEALLIDATDVDLVTNTACS